MLKEQLLKLQPGKLLLPAQGEVRNDLFAAANGWDVIAFDFSTEAENKAMLAAVLRQVQIDHRIQDIRELILPSEQFDVIGLIYVHLEPELRMAFHRKCIDALAPQGCFNS